MQVTNEKLWELEQECIAEKGVREKENVGEEELPRKFTEGFNRSFYRPQQAP